MKSILVITALLGALAVASAQLAKIPTGFTTLIRTAVEGNEGKLRTPEGLPFGAVYDENMKHITDKNGKKVYGDYPDSTTIHKVGDKIFLITQIEWPQPATMWSMELSQDMATGALSVVNIKAVNTKSIFGATVLCAGDHTPWNTHIGGEEWEPDARLYEAAIKANSTKDVYSVIGSNQMTQFVTYFNLPSNYNLTTVEAVDKVFNPYNYGHKIEVAVDDKGNHSFVKKWRTMGRHQVELSYTMPDLKTVYITDDGTAKALNVFVMDKEKDLSSGTMYVAKFTQTDAANGGKFTVEWIKMSSGNQAELEAMAKDTKFSNIFEYAKYDVNATSPCPEGFKSINSGSVGVECLKLKAGMEKAATFLETRRYSAYLGGTTEANKWEGITWDADNGYLYTAISTVENGMEDNKVKNKADKKRDIGGPNHMKLEYNRCGCLYKMKVDPTKSPMLATTFDAIWCGSDKQGTDEYNKCDVDNVANPDNIHYIPGTGKMLVGEDSGDHQNNLIWMYDVKSGKRTRYFATPMGAETTSPYWYEINGWSYAIAVMQHPYEDYEDKLNETESTGLGGYIGYVGPFKTADLKGTSNWDFEPIMTPRGVDRHKVISSQAFLYSKTVSDTTTPSNTTTKTNSAGAAASSSLLVCLLALAFFLLA